MLNKQVFHYLSATFLATIAYTLPHSILTVLLLSKGLSISQILLIQSAYSLAIVLCEFPSGMLADTWSRKKLYLLSRVLLIVMFSLILLSSNFYVLYLTWFIYGIASAFESGTLDAYLINQLKSSANNKRIETFISQDNRIQFLGMMIGSGIGGLLYFVIGVHIYVIAIILVVLSSLEIGLFFKETEVQDQSKVSLSSLRAQIAVSLKELKENKLLRVIMLFDMLTQLFFQAHFQLWQSFLLEKGIDKRYFTLFYFLFQIISITAYSIPTQRFQKMISYRFYLLAFLVLPLCFMTRIPFIYLFAYIFYIFIFYIIQFVLSVYFNKQVSTETISSLTSLKSTISRLGGIIILYILSISVRIVSVSFVVTMAFIISFLLIILLAGYFLKRFGIRE